MLAHRKVTRDQGKFQHKNAFRCYYASSSSEYKKSNNASVKMFRRIF